MWRLIWVCIVFQWLFYGFPGKNGLMCGTPQGGQKSKVVKKKKTVQTQIRCLNAASDLDLHYLYKIYSNFYKNTPDTPKMVNGLIPFIRIDQSTGHKWLMIWWMVDLQIYVLSNSISVISGWWTKDNERLCAMEPHLRLRRFPLELDLNLVQLD